MSVLVPKIQKLIQEERDRLIRDQITPWIMGLAVGKLSIENFYKKKISYGGVKFEGSPRNVFWGRYIEPFLEDTTDRLISLVAQECKDSNLNFEEELNVLSGQLKGLYFRIFHEMVKADQRMRGNGYPERVPVTDVSRNIAVMNNYLEQHLRMEMDKYKSRMRASENATSTSIWKKIWKNSIGGQVIATVIAAVIISTGSGIWWALVGGFHSTSGEHTAAAPHIEQSPCSINTNGQTGGNNSIDCSIKKPPPPELKQLSPADINATPEPTKNSDGTFVYQYLFEWTSQSPDTWRVTACGEGVKETSIVAPITGHAGLRGDCAFSEVDKPFGRYVVVVISSKETKLSLKHGLPDGQPAQEGDQLSGMNGY